MADHDMATRVGKIEHDLYRPDIDNPGALMRLDRVERLLSTMLKVGGALAGCGIAYKALDVIGAIIQAKVGP